MEVGHWADLLPSPLSSMEEHGMVTNRRAMRATGYLLMLRNILLWFVCSGCGWFFRVTGPISFLLLCTLWDGMAWLQQVSNESYWLPAEAQKHPSLLPLEWLWLVL